jgi:hypothetical protein
MHMTICLAKSLLLIYYNRDFLQNPYLFMCVSLVHPNTHEEMINSPQNTLSGQTCSSMYKLKDINNHGKV